MSKAAWSLGAIAAAAAALTVGAWYDVAFLSDALRSAHQRFDSASVTPLFAFGSVLVAGAVIALAALAWRSASSVVGIVFIVVGAFFAALWWLWAWLTGSINGATPILPDPLVSVLSTIWIDTQGPLNAVSTIGAGMLIAGVVALVRAQRLHSRQVASGAGIGLPST